MTDPITSEPPNDDTATSPSTDAAKLAERQAGNFAWMLTSMTDWVHRRVESVRFADAHTVVRRTSVDFTLPTGAAEANVEGEWLVPIALMTKTMLSSLNVVDSTGASLPVLTATQNGDLVCRALHSTACAVLTDADPKVNLDVMARIDPMIRALVFGVGDPAKLAKEQLAKEIAADAESGGPLSPLSGWFMSIAAEYESNFVMVVQIRMPVGSRTVVKFEYAADITRGDDERTARQRVADRLGWFPDTYRFEIPGAARAASFHFEAVAPDGSAITEGVISHSDPELNRSWNLSRDGRQILHMMAPEAGIDGYTAQFNLRVAKVGWLRTCVAASWALTISMLLSTARLPALSQPSTDGDLQASVDVAAMLVTVVAFLAAFIVRTGEHGLTSRLLFWVRAVVLVGVLATFFAAWLLAFGPSSSGALTVWWSAVTFVNWLAMVSLTWTYRGPRLLTR